MVQGPTAAATATAAAGAAQPCVSLGSLTLRVLDIEELIPWGSVRTKDASCDWADVRPTWLELVEKARDVPTLAHSLATLEAVLKDKALVDGWRAGGKHSPQKVA